jgi:hypothetical protein
MPIITFVGVFVSSIDRRVASVDARGKIRRNVRRRAPTKVWRETSNVLDCSNAPTLDRGLTLLERSIITSNWINIDGDACGLSPILMACLYGGAVLGTEAQEASIVQFCLNIVPEFHRNISFKP